MKMTLWKGLQEVKELVAGACGEECSGRWNSHCKSPEAGASGMFKNSKEASVAEPGGGREKWKAGAAGEQGQPRRVLGRQRKIKDGLGPEQKT